MCTTEYRTEFSCDLPYVKDDAGNCSILAEQYILQHGPSRLVITIIAPFFSLFCLWVGWQKFWMTLGDSKIRHWQTYEEKPGLKLYVLTIVFPIIFLLHNIDMHGN